MEFSTRSNHSEFILLFQNILFINQTKRLYSKVTVEKNNRTILYTYREMKQQEG
jgi:hypothetical protein